METASNERVGMNYTGLRRPIPENRGHIHGQGAVHSASHISATYAVFTKKGTPAESRNPFKNCDGADGGI